MQKHIEMLDKIDEANESGFDSEESYDGPLEDGEFSNVRIGIDENTQGTVLGQVPWGAGKSGLAGMWKCRLHNPEKGWATWYVEEQEFESLVLEKSKRKRQRNRKQRR
jgi:hypothetical protein